MRWSGLSGGSLSLYIMPVGNAGRPMFTRMSGSYLAFLGRAPVQAQQGASSQDQERPEYWVLERP